ncbi:hypothetical protein V1511DRAFT_457805, partial [Dipodascopsis uninucleata]
LDFSYEDIPDLSGNVAVVTDANSGIGESTAKELARKGCKVYMTCRSEERATDAIARIEKEIGSSANLVFLELDLESMKKATTAAEMFAELEDRLDILIANAGLVFADFSALSNSNDTTIQHLGHFAFVKTLLPLLRKTNSELNSDVRIVVVASNLYRLGISFFSFSTFRRYCHSKFANVLFVKELTEVLNDTNIYVNAIHPGRVKTNIQDLDNAPVSFLVKFLTKYVIEPTSLSAYDGAKASLFAAVDKRAREPSHKEKLPCPHIVSYCFRQLCDGVLLSSGKENANSTEERKKLWEYSEKALTEALK